MNKMKKAVFLLSCILTISLFNGCGTDSPPDTFATIYGQIIDNQSGDPIAVASVVLLPSGKTQISGTDGRFEFKNLDEGQYTITVQKEGYSSNRKIVTALAGESTEANIPLAKIQ